MRKLLIVLIILAGCKQIPNIDDPNNIEDTVENENMELFTINGDYTIIKDANHLVVDFWDNSGWYVNEGEGVKIFTLRRVEVTQPYIITINEPNLLTVISFERENNEEVDNHLNLIIGRVLK
ncbi:MAG TPA: hypothetical protein ENH85_02630 [Candidatus Scalindua sp.]|nr:hypothetical protein [Candidatus Scalindua sp.]